MEVHVRLDFNCRLIAMGASSDPIGGSQMQVQVQQLGLENQYSGALN
jgi:hypothetical protein